MHSVMFYYSFSKEVITVKAIFPSICTILLWIGVKSWSEEVWDEQLAAIIQQKTSE